MSDYSHYDYLDITVDDGVALVEISHPQYSQRGHYEVNGIWHDLDRDPDVRSVLLTWAIPPSKLPPTGKDWFPPEMGPEAAAADPAKWWSRWQWSPKEARDGINAVLNSSKIIVSALRGDVSFGAPLILATVADVSIAANDAVIADRHIDNGIVPGDGAVHWMQMCGVQKAKFLALTGEDMTGEEAAHIGLVTMALPDEEVMDAAWHYARRFANGPQHVQNFTKRAFNNWMRMGSLLTFDLSCALEVGNIQSDPDTAVGVGWGMAAQGKPGGYDRSTRPPYPSVSNPVIDPYGPPN
jgi:enoyl-CoA hydratase